MEPLTPQVRQAVLDANAAAEPEDLDEYEQLLASRFATDPDAPEEPAAPDADPTSARSTARAIAADQRQAREHRLAELHDKLFPGAARRR